MQAPEFQPRALDDIRAAMLWYRDEVSSALADRFLDAVENTVAFLATRPGIGSPCLYDDRELKGMRRWPVKGFERWLIFYLSELGLIEVVRVFHGARNFQEIFEAGFLDS